MGENYNEKITTKILKIEDIYDGIYAQAFGNTEFIYKLTLKDGEWIYTSVFQIKEQDLVKYDESNVYYSRPARIRANEEGFISWCETIWTRKLNPNTMREDKIKQIGI